MDKTTTQIARDKLSYFTFLKGDSKTRSFAIYDDFNVANSRSMINIVGQACEHRTAEDFTARARHTHSISNHKLGKLRAGTAQACADLNTPGHHRPRRPT